MKKITVLNMKLNPLFLFPLYILCFILIICSLFSFSTHKMETQAPEIIHNNSEASHLVKVKLADGSTKEFEMEDYLIGVVAAEMPPSFEAEALKAQAIAARTYIINRQKNASPDHPEADVCTVSAHCKAYTSEDEALMKWSEEWKNTYKDKISNAVNSTTGMIVTYDNEPITAVFHSTSGGKTENSEDVWQSKTPYLKSVESEGEELSPRFKSQVEISLDEFILKIKEMDSAADLSQNKITVSDYEYTEGGSVKFVKIGGVKLKGTDIRSKFGLRSANFIITVGDSVKFDVTGNGHGVGMSQYGANYAAASGSNYEQILKKYYQGTEIEKIY